MIDQYIIRFSFNPFWQKKSEDGVDLPQNWLEFFPTKKTQLRARGHLGGEFSTDSASIYSDVWRRAGKRGPAVRVTMGQTGWNIASRLSSNSSHQHDNHDHHMYPWLYLQYWINWMKWTIQYIFCHSSVKWLPVCVYCAFSLSCQDILPAYICIPIIWVSRITNNIGQKWFLATRLCNNNNKMENVWNEIIKWILKSAILCQSISSALWYCRRCIAIMQ